MDFGIDYTVSAMFIERKINSNTDQVELWECEWDNPPGGNARKKYIAKIGEESQSRPDAGDAWNDVEAVVWATERTLGNIAVFSPRVIGSFPGVEGSDAVLPCDFLPAGKFRHGAQRWWCRTHQTHWGTKADVAAYQQTKEFRCANHIQKLHYTKKPYVLNPEKYAEVGVWCSLPKAISTQPIPRRAPKIHLHLRKKSKDSLKLVDDDFSVVSVLYRDSQDLFSNSQINRVNITPPAAWEFVRALEENREMSCIDCKNCGYPHLDLGDFAHKPHKKHFCGNCGIDSLWSKTEIVSTPLKPLYDQLARSTTFIVPDREINLDDYSDCDYDIWASTPAVMWTANRSQEKGIHVHIMRNGKRIVDDTFGNVFQNGKKLSRPKLLKLMYDRIIT